MKMRFLNFAAVLLISVLFMNCSNDDVVNSTKNEIDVVPEESADNTPETDTTEEEITEETPTEEEEEVVVEETEEESTIEPYGDLDPNLPPSRNFDLSNWYISLPTDEDNNGKTDNIYEAQLNNGFEYKDYFYTGKDGGMVFKCPVRDAATSTNSSYFRVELREMLRNGDTSIKNAGVNKNNWVFSSAPAEDLEAAAAVDGEMTATLAVNKVTTTGDNGHIGRLIIGQIHANTDEPIRIYYRKLKDNELGSIYFAHEINHGDDTYHNMIGDRSNNRENPIDGIALNEKFTYNIKVVGNEMWVTLSREGKADIVQYVDMSSSGYDEGGQYQYFKAGIYHVNNSGDDEDYAQVTFYNLEVKH